ncbi:SICA antigen [Plasmodium coatneyi]|uniref:SICA antigen n=1 Tax=Plasmodium coatneyi TaxID=208452 RepID=A0A1B1E1Y1_9APIC|nr:SICA antigen [Plasmodium coatneyi]ANQ08960.1 SICA antigen [Plasmodium coatneyi]
MASRKKGQFEVLVDEWYNSNGKKKREDEEKLWKELTRYIDEFMNGMGRVDSEGERIGKDGCEVIEAEGRNMTSEEKKWCIFLLKNSWIMEKLNRSESKLQEWNKNIRAFIRCTVMRVWFHIYMNINCEADTIITGASNGVFEMCKGMSGGEGCNKCEYGEFESMYVNGKSVLGHILDKIHIGEKIIRMRSGISFSEKCERNTDGTGNQQPRGGGTEDVMAQDVLSQVKEELNTENGQQKHSPKIVQPDTPEIKFKDDFLIKWIWVHGDPMKKGLSKGIWDDMKKVFDDMMENIDRDGKNDQGYCSTLQRVHNNTKELCKIVLRIFFWMDGLEQKWVGEMDDEKGYFDWRTRTDEAENEKELLPYYRCLLGKVTMLKMLGRHCKLGEIAQEVINKRNGFRKSKGDFQGNTLCKDVNVKNFKWGGRLIWQQVSEWIDDYKRPEVPEKALRAVTAGNSPLHIIKEQGEQGCMKENMDKQILKKLEIEADADEVLNIVEEDVTLDKSALEEIMHKVEVLRKSDKIPSMKDGEISQEIIQQVERVIQEVYQKELKKLKPQNMPILRVLLPQSRPEQKGDDCNQGKLCARANCVTHHWFKDRVPRVGSGRQNWCNFWGDKDVGKVLKELSNAMKNGSTDIEVSCKNFTRAKGETATESEKKACNLIVTGLRHIYSIQENERDYYLNQKKNNRIFYQTMACAFLNAYADKLEQHSTCPIGKDIIQQAFEKGNGNKDTWCKDKNNKSLNCAECNREPNLTCTLSVSEGLLDKKKGEKCKGDRINIQNKLGKMLDPTTKGDPKVKPALKEINDICPTKPPEAPRPQAAKPATTKPTGNTDQASSDQNSETSKDSAENLPGEVTDAKPDYAGSGDDDLQDTRNAESSSAEGSTPQTTGQTTPPSIPRKAPTSSKALKSSHGTKEGITSIDSFLSYLPTIPVTIAIYVTSYLLWKYFGILRKTRKRYRRAYQVRGPSLQEQIMDHVDQDGPREYCIVKERKQPRSAPNRRRKRERPGRRAAGRRRDLRRGVGRRMIIDIHLEVLDECQKGHLHSTNEDFFEILVQKFMGSEFIKEEKVPSSYSGFREEDIVPKECFAKEYVPSSDSGF